MKREQKKRVVNHQQRNVYLVLLTFTLLWNALFLSVPMLEKSGNQKTAFIVRLFYAPVCHQNADRSFTVGENTLPVCARCTGLYLGFLAGVLLIPLWRVHMRWLRSKRRSGLSFRTLLIIGAGLMAIEWTLSQAGILPASNMTRALISSIPAAVLALLTFQALSVLTQPKEMKTVSNKKDWIWTNDQAY